MEKLLTSEKQIESFHKSQLKELEQRKQAFEEKDKHIQGRIEKLSKSKERMNEAIKRDHEIRFMETQNRFKNNLTTYRDTVRERFNSKLSRTESKIQEIKEEMSFERSKKREIKQNSIQKVLKRNEQLMAVRKQEMIDKNVRIDKYIENKQKEFEAEKLQKLHEAQIKQKHRDQVRAKVDSEFVDKISKVTEKLDRIDK